MDQSGNIGLARMTKLVRGMVVDVNLNPVKGSETGKIRPCVIVTNNQYNARVPVIQVVPLTAWSEKKARIVTNVEIFPTASNGCTKRSVADCLQTRPVDRHERLVRVRGTLAAVDLKNIDSALKLVFSLN